MRLELEIPGIFLLPFLLMDEVLGWEGKKDNRIYESFICIMCYDSTVSYMHVPYLSNQKGRIMSMS